MGWMCSWVAVQTSQKAEMLEAIGFAETGEMVEPGSGASKWSVGEIPDGWLVLFSEDFDWGAPQRARELSAFGRAVSLQFEDKVDMASIASEARDGVQLWQVSHVNGEDEELTVIGDPPPAFERIRDELMRIQDEDDRADYLHDIPIDTAKAVCGYRADEFLPSFAALRRSGGSMDPRSTGQGAGLFGFLKGLFGGAR